MVIESILALLSLIIALGFIFSTLALGVSIWAISRTRAAIKPLKPRFVDPATDMSLTAPISEEDKKLAELEEVYEKEIKRYSPITPRKDELI